MASEAQRRAGKKYDQENTVVFTIKLNKKTDADIIKELTRQANKQGFIKDLIREHRKKRKK